MKIVIPLWDDPELEKNFPPEHYQIRKDIRGLPPRELMREMRKLQGSLLILWAYDRKVLRNYTLWEGLALLAGTKKKQIWDKLGRKRTCHWGKWLYFSVSRTLGQALLLPFRLLYLQLSLLWLQLKLNFKRSSWREKGKTAFLRTDLWFGVRAGGSVGHLAGVIKGLLQNQFHPVIFSTDFLPGVDAGKLDFNLVRSRIASASFREIPELVYNFKTIKLASAKLKADPPDFIYQRYSLDNFAGLWLAAKLKIPLALEYNGSFLWMEKHWGSGLAYPGLAAKIEELNLRYADLIVVVSRVMKDELLSRGFAPEKILVNPNGVDLDLFSSQTEEKARELRRELGLEDKILAGFIGTFGPWHGVIELAKAIQPAVEGNPRLHFLLMGTGPLEAQVREIVQAAGMKERVTFTGLIPQQEAPVYLSACDILLSPHVPNRDGSRFFGSPTKLFEYMAAGKGIVASRLEQIGEILEAGKTALLVEPGNIKELAEQIIYLADNQPVRERLGAAAREVARQKHGWRENVNNVLAALKEKFKP